MIAARHWRIFVLNAVAKIQRASGTMLAEIYGWFTEGFDTADLIDAKALLDELSTQNAMHQVIQCC